MISTRGRYALRVLIDLAQQQSDKYIPLEEIASRQGISKKYLEIIIKILMKERLLDASRGKGGGYKLARDPKEYNVAKILELTEGTLAPVACLKNNAEDCARREICKTLPMWKEYHKITQDFFSSITIADLAGESSVPPSDGFC